LPAKLNKSTEQLSDKTNHSIAADSNLQWHSVTSKSLYDVPRLSNQYSDIPLRITIPEGTPTHNQKLLHKHNIALEQRLLDAGLSPETIALYERILEVADVHQLSPPEIIDQYQHQSML
jgi:arginyl-tRNA--protein-N-Asp/Glu arginylyltransferase